MVINVFEFGVDANRGWIGRVPVENPGLLFHSGV